LSGAPGLRDEVSVHQAIAEIGRDAWDACAAATDYAGNPFVSFAFLDALEQTGCASPRTGWSPSHIRLKDEAGETAAVMPLYVKSHSRGEYVFDHAWADAYERAGGRYYPKRPGCSPFSPVTGPRLLVRPDGDRQEAQTRLIGGALTLCQKLGASGVNITFPTQEEWSLLGHEGLLQRQDQQYQWFNNGYVTFDDFLAALSSNRRKTIRRERREALAQVDVVALTGADLTETHWDAFFGFYMDTGDRKWGRPYLTRAFFSMLSERRAAKVLLLLARRNGRWVAGALNLLGDDCLYGRHWGCSEDIPFLHFELCYYQAIEHAIRLGLPRVEAGAQGQHKIARGYLPAAVYSAHYIRDPALRAPIARYLDQEREAVQQEMDWLAEEYSPFKEA
jgi:predicted N-acyltransferase